MELLDPAKEYKEVEELGNSGLTQSSNFKNVLTLVKKRGPKRATITKFINNNKNNLTSFSINELKGLINNLKTKLKDIIEIDNEILNLYAECDEFTFEGSEKLSSKNDFYTLALDTLLNEVESFINPTQITSSNISHSETGFSGLKRPEVQLPEFDGKPEEFERFITNFEEIMDRENYNKYARHSCLLRQLKGTAKILIQKSPVADMDYDMAKELLTDAFANKTLQQFSVIEKLSKLKLQTDFYGWIGDARLIESQLDSLDITNKVFAQYFLWNGLPEQYKHQYINITNKTYPTLDEILKHSFEIQNRMKEGGFVRVNANVHSKTSSNASHTIQNTSHIEKKTVSLATNIDMNESGSNAEVKKRAMYCSICQALKTSDYTEHRLLNCPNYKTAESKLGKLKELGGCVKCGYVNHTIDSCRFKFTQKCRNCNKWHFTFLCTINNKQNKNVAQNTNNKKHNYNTQTETSTNVVELNITPVENPSSEQLQNSFQLSSMNTTCTVNNTLPTFTANCINKNNNNHDLRVLYDSGSELNFITQKTAQKLKYKIIQSNIMLNIKGFNETKYYQTHIIEFDVKIKNKIHSIIAAVVPSIQTKVNIPNPQILKTFKERKISLADKHLGNKSNREIHILLGVNGAHILPVNACSFGLTTNPSLLYYTSLGMLLAGDLNNLIKNLPYLHILKNFMEQVDLLHEKIKITNKTQ